MSGRSVPVAKVTDIEPGSGACVEVEGRRIAVFNLGGEFRAIDDECPHQGGPLSEGSLAGCLVTCPWHAWEFDLSTGELDGDSGTRLATYSVRIEGEDVLIHLPE